MLVTKDFFEALGARDINFFTGVPDSLLKHFCAYVTDNTDASHNVIAANEGNAIALAAGYHLATGKLGLVYMQNSGLGNSVNPLASLADPDVYGIPMVLVIGWRGEPGKKDEPQHVKMGKVTHPLLEAIDVPFEVLPEEPTEALACLDRIVATVWERRAPAALVVKKGTFEPYELQNVTAQPYAMTRERAIELVIDAMPANTPIVSTTGKCSRELFELRNKRSEPHDGDFLTVGSMGHSCQIALGVALGRPERPIYCFDGDGAAIMHMGAMAIIGDLAPRNYKHVVFNNGAHDSVGGQPTVGHGIDLCAVAKANGYARTFCANDEASLAALLPEFVSAEGPALLEVRVKKGARAELGRPTQTPQALKEQFMAVLAK